MGIRSSCCAGPTLYPQLRIDHGGGDRPDKRQSARGWRLRLCLPLDRLQGASLQLWRLSTLKRAIWTSFFLAAWPAGGPRLRRLVDPHWKVRVCCEWRDYGRFWRRTFRWVAEEKWRPRSCQRKQDGELREQDSIQTGNSINSMVFQATDVRKPLSAVSWIQLSRMCRILAGIASEQRSLFSLRSQACETHYPMADGVSSGSDQRLPAVQTGSPEQAIDFEDAPESSIRKPTRTADPCCRPMFR